MKPFGSITNTLPFIETEYIQDLELLIHQSNNYADFSEKLCNYVLSIDPSQSMVYLAWYHTYNTNDVQTFEKLIRKFPYSPLTRPWFTWWSMTVKGVWNWNLLLEETEHAISSTNNPWIQFDLYNLDWLNHFSLGNLAEDAIIQKMTELIQHDKRIQWFQSRIYSNIADRCARDSNYSEALSAFDSALQLAMKYDDIDYTAKTKIGLAYLLARIGPFDAALETIESAEKIVRELGYVEKRMDLESVKGVIFYSRAEYNAASESFLEAVRIRERLSTYLSLRLLPVGLSRIYRTMGQGEEALEWAKIAFTAEPNLSFVHHAGLYILANLYMAGALAILDRSEEAHPFLNTASEFILKSGNELWLADMYMISGLIERGESKYVDALGNFEKALKIVTRLKRQGRINEYLIRLAETEILLHFKEDLERSEEYEFHWTCQLEERGRTKQLPGVIGIALLLKARTQLLQNRTIEAKTTLSQIRKLAKNPVIRYLEAKADSLASIMLPDVIRDDSK